MRNPRWVKLATDKAFNLGRQSLIKEVENGIWSDDLRAACLAANKKNKEVCKDCGREKKWFMKDNVDSIFGCPFCDDG